MEASKINKKIVPIKAAATKDLNIRTVLNN